MIKERCEKLIELEKEDHATVTVVLLQRLSEWSILSGGKIVIIAIPYLHL